MGRKKLRLEPIASHSYRLATLKKRKASLIKKARELSTLCGVPVCTVISDGPHDPAPDMWPQSEEGTQILSRFTSLSEKEHTKNLSRQVAMLQLQLQKVKNENLSLETEILLKNSLVGGFSVADVASAEIATSLPATVERRLKEVHDRMNSLASAPVQLCSAAMDVGCGTGSGEATVPAPALWPNTESEPLSPWTWTMLRKDVPQLFEVSAMEKDPFFEWINADATYLPEWHTVEEKMSGLVAESDMERDTMLEWRNADVTCLAGAFTLEEEMPGFIDESDMERDWISGTATLPGWHEVRDEKGWMFGPDTADVAPLAVEPEV